MHSPRIPPTTAPYGNFLPELEPIKCQQPIYINTQYEHTHNQAKPILKA
jgi:hypothetical protein